MRDYNGYNMTENTPTVEYRYRLLFIYFSSSNGVVPVGIASNNNTLLDNL